MVSQNSSLRQLFIKKKPVVVILSIFAIGLTAFIVIWLNLSWRPDISSLPPDSGFYAYIGKAILHGQIPYRDVWDDKPPLGYYQNAFALFIFGQTAWGVWWSSVAWITGCVLLLFLVIKRLFGGITAGVTSVIFLVGLMNPKIFQGGNMMEVYGLAPQIGVIGITFLFFAKHRKFWFSVLVGVLTACAFLIKQPTIILGCSSILMMTICSLSERKFREAFRSAMGFLSGAVGLVAMVSAYWLWVGAFGYLLDGALLQGISFIGDSESHLREYFVDILVKVIPKLSFGNLYLIAMLAAGLFLLVKLYQFWLKPILKTRLSSFEWCLLIIFALVPLVGKWHWPNLNFGKFWLISIFGFGLYFLAKFYRIRPRPVYHQVFSPVEWTWLVAVIALPLEVLMASLGGRYYWHYFITVLPAVMLTIAYPIWKALSLSRETFKLTGSLAVNAVYVILMIGILVWGVTLFVQDLPSGIYTNDVVGIFRGQTHFDELEQHIIQTTQPDDKVLVWHIHLGINFVTDRNAPSRFLYPLNLFIPPNEGNTKLEEYVNDLENNPPELIIVQKVSSLGLPFVDTPVDQLSDSGYTPDFKQAINVPQIRQEWLRFQQFFVTHYALDRKIYDWTIYRKLP